MPPRDRKWTLVPALFAALAAAGAIAVMALPLGASGAPGNLLGAGATTGTTAPPVPITGELTISAEDRRLTYGRRTTIRGRLKGTLKAGVPVNLQHNPAPYTGGPQTVATATTSTSGRYSFRNVEPDRHTRYRVVSTVPQATSKEVLVEVRIKVVLRLDDRTPRRGQRVRFYGTAAPEHDGRLVYIQRRNAAGRWRTAKRTVLEDAGDELSIFSKRIRVRRKGTYRALVFHDSDHRDSTSRPKRARVH